jgi:hypothetical protein
MQSLFLQWKKDPPTSKVSGPFPENPEMVETILLYDFQDLP